MMKYIAALLAFGAAVAVSAQSCQETYGPVFTFQAINQTNSTRGSEKLFAYNCKNLTSLKLTDGVLLDSKGRTGYIGSNEQFQFDDPPQADHKEAGGFGICDGNYVGLNGNTTWYNCLSHIFHSIYDESLGSQCFPVYISIFNCASPTAFPTSPTGIGTSVSSGVSIETTAAAATPLSSTSSANTTVSSAPTSFSSEESTPAFRPGVVTGICIGSIFGAAIIILLVSLSIRLARIAKNKDKNSKTKNASPSDAVADEPPLGEIDEDTPPYEMDAIIERPHELLGQSRAELPGQALVELHASPELYALPELKG